MFHRSPLVRSNTAQLLLQQPPSAQRNQQLLRLLQQDDSIFVRTSTARALRRAGPTVAIPPELRQAASVASSADASDSADASAATPATEIPAWRLFDIVVGNGSSQPARAEPYFFVLPSGLAEAAYSDDTGTIMLEHFVGGELEFAARNTEDDL